MLKQILRGRRRVTMCEAQRGVVLIVALLVLVVMTLAGIALMRSMDTSALVAGNMAFKQAALHAADTGVESAIAWLEQANAANGLEQTNGAAGYTASTVGNSNFLASDVFWDKLAPSGVCHLNQFGQGCTPAPEANVNGNKISYMIQRLCEVTGASNTSRCAVVAGTAVASGQNEGAGEDRLSGTFLLVYYRITVRVVGPRNGVSYVQTVVSI